MQMFSNEWFAALMAIVVIDLVLGGDNAIVIGLAARNVEPRLRKKVIFWGAIGAVVVRATLTLFVVWLLKIPGFLLAGGLALVWIAFKLVEPREEVSGAHAAVAKVNNFRSALQTIIIADAVMGVDNVLGVGGAAHGSFELVVIGLLISVPIVMFGSTLILGLVDRYPSIIAIGGAVLAWTAGSMIAKEPLIKDWLHYHPGTHYILSFVLIAAVLFSTFIRKVWRESPGLVASLIFFIVWLEAFRAFEAYIEWDLHPLDENWGWWYELVDLTMWVGWIPFAVLITRHLPWRRSDPKTDPAGKARELGA